MKRVIVIAALISTLIVVVLIIMSVGGEKPLGSNDDKINKTLVEYTSQNFSISHPAGYIDISDGIGTQLTYSKGDVSEKIAIQKYTPVGVITEDELLKSANGVDLSYAKKIDINGRRSVAIKNGKDTSTPITRVYVFGDTYVWLITLTAASKSNLDKNTEKIYQSFKITTESET